MFLHAIQAVLQQLPNSHLSMVLHAFQAVLRHQLQKFHAILHFAQDFQLHITIFPPVLTLYC